MVDLASDHDAAIRLIMEEYARLKNIILIMNS
jgi:hypothetical protein